MKLLFNIMTTVSFLGVVSIAAGGAYVYVNKDAITENVKGQIERAITEAVLGEAVPTLPGVGGDSGGSTGLPVPNPVVPF